MVDFEDIEVKIELDDLDLHSMLNTPDDDYGLLVLNEPQQQDLNNSTVDTRQTQDNEGLRTELAATPTVDQVQDSEGYVAVATNIAQNIEPTFNITEQATTFFSRENPSTTLPVVMDNRDLLPQIFSDSSAPPLAVGTIQAQNTEPTFDITEQPIFFTGENLSTTLPLGMDDRDLLPQLLPSSPALLLNETQSSYLSPSMVQLTSEGENSSILNYDINLHRAWDSQRPPQYFTTLLQQDSDDSAMQNILDIQSQHSVLPVCQTYPWSEPYVQPTLVPVPPNLYDHQHAYRSMLPEPLFPPGFDNQNNQYYSQAMMPNGHVEQGVGSSVQLSGGFTRPERASNIQLQQVAPVSANRVTTQWKGKNVLYEQRRRGRPPKRHEAGESSSCLRHRKIKKGSSGTENVGTNGVQNTNPTNPSSAPNPRVFVNGMYGSAFERNGLPTDPHLRLFRALSDK